MLPKKIFSLTFYHFGFNVITSTVDMEKEIIYHIQYTSNRRVEQKGKDMSETTNTSVWDPALPIEFRVEAFYAQNPTALTQWHRTEWSKFFEKMPLAERIELCDSILKEEKIINYEVAAYLANAVIKCGNSEHVRWDAKFRKKKYLVPCYIPELKCQMWKYRADREDFWCEIENHLEYIWDEPHEKIYQAVPLLYS